MLKLVLLIAFAIIAIIAAMAGYFFGVNKKTKPDEQKFRKLVKFRVICYIIMMMLLFVMVIL